MLKIDLFFISFSPCLRQFTRNGLRKHQLPKAFEQFRYSLYTFFKRVQVQKRSV